MNNNQFWKEYNKIQIERIVELINRQKHNGDLYVFADFHMHSNKSSDSKQSLKEILENTKSKGFDIISITDHDDVRIYDEVYDFVKSHDMSQYPILITGIEHTVSYPKYGEMCHILKHFINPKDEEILRDIKIVEDSYFNRAKIQIQRIFESPVLSNLIVKKGMQISYEGFLEYLNSKCIAIPDYAPLIDYLADIFKEYNVDFQELFDKLIVANEIDECEERKDLKKARFEKLANKYIDKNIQDNRRFLLSILAVRGVDDFNYEGYKSSGSLSVNEYGQVDIFKLNQCGVTSFAHPTEKVVETLVGCSEIGGKLIGIENNFKNPYEDINNFYKVKDKMSLVELKGSDCHATTELVYEDMSFYKIKIEELEKYIEIVKRLIL